MGKTLCLGTALFVACASPALAQSYAKISKNDARALASNCMQCHGTNGQPRNGGATSLVGTTYSKLRQQMIDLSNKVSSASPDVPTSDPQKDLMIRHAKAYTLDEIEAIASYLSGYTGP